MFGAVEGPEHFFGEDLPLYDQRASTRYPNSGEEGLDTDKCRKPGQLGLDCSPPAESHALAR